LYGHEIGHFWGEFLPGPRVIRICQHLWQADEQGVLLETLECFEAAANADVRSLGGIGSRAAAAYMSARHTRKLLCLISDFGLQALTDARCALGRGWYDLLGEDDAALVNKLALLLRQ